MNKQKPGGIGWCDYTWNVVSGCWGPGGTAAKPNRCAYCDAEKVANRFNRHALGDPFMPMFYPDRLSQPAKVKKPSKIFVCSMADLFGDWVPSPWVIRVLEVPHDNPQHIFQFLTKNPKRLSQWNGFWSPNCWVGTTVTNQADADERLPWLLQADAPVRFVSHEPLLGAIDVKTFVPVPYHASTYPLPVPPKINWAIIGAQTGPGAVKVKVDWVMNLAEQYHAAGVPLFLKDNLGFSDQPREFPLA
jgi:protein gp37